MKTYKYHYVYRITNTVTQMYYYGDRSCNCQPSEDIGVKYFSSFSNKLFKEDQKNNPSDYTYKIIKIFKTCREDAKQLEVELHSKFDVKNNPKFINRANQTSNGFTAHNEGSNNSFYGKKHSTTTKLLMKKNHADFSGQKHPLYGKKHSEETKKKMSVKKQNYKGENHPQYGKALSEERKSKISKSLMGNKPSNIKLMLLTDPKGNQFFIDGNLIPFCKCRKLNHMMFREMLNHNIIPTKRSKCYGWTIREAKRIELE